MPPPRLACMMQPFSHRWHLSLYVVSSSGQKASLFRDQQSAHYAFRHHFQKTHKSPKSTVHPAPTGSQAAECCSHRASTLQALQGRQRGKIIAFISICKAFLCSHVPDRHFAYFQLAIKPIKRDGFSFAPAALAGINTPMFPPAERFPERCKVPGCPSACRCTVSLLTRRKAGPTEMKQKKSPFLTAAAAKRERDAKNKTSLSPRRCTITKVLHGTA